MSDIDQLISQSRTSSLSPLQKTSQDNSDLMVKIATDQQTIDDIRLLTSSKVTDQLKVFLIAQARSELVRVIKLTQFLDKIENKFISKAEDAMLNDELTFKQYNEIITMIITLLQRSNDIITKIIKDDSLTTILNTTIYMSSTTSAAQESSVVSQLKDAQSRERVRTVLQQIILKTEEYNSNNSNSIIIEGDTNDA